MLDPELMKILRCPIDPKREATLSQPDETHLACDRCHVRYQVRDGFPILLMDEAQLPANCSTIDKLPCLSEKA